MRGAEAGSGRSVMTPREELRALADAVLEETITAEEMDRLAALLRNDPDAQSYYLAYLDLEAGLHLEMRGGAGAMPATRRRRRAGPRLALAAAAALLLAGLGYAVLRPESAPALLSRVHQATWTGRLTPIAGAALPLGIYTLSAGVAEVRFSGGVTAIVEGPSGFEVGGPLRLVLRSGQVVCRAAPGTKGFTVATSKADILDLGTEFGVRVGDADRTEVQVYEGEVVTSFKEIPGERRLRGGEALDVDAAPRDIPFRPYRFMRTLPGPDDPRGRGKHPYNLSRYDQVHLVPAPAGVVIDGTLSDWDLSGRFSTSCEPPYEAYALEGAMMFDARGLYLGGHVGDPHPMRSRISPELPREVYGMGGCVAFRISTDRKMGWPVRGRHADLRKGQPAVPEDTSGKLAFLALWYYEPDRKPCLHVRYGMDLHGTTVNPAGYRGSFRKDDDGQGYTFEYFIPWEILHAADDPPRGGDVLGAMCLVHWS
ncbi:MAG: hypothetical protein EHM91_06440, partial [Planctomycetota bacterium]